MALFDQLPGADLVLVRRSDSAKFDLQWDSLTNNPVFGDDQTHAVLSLIYEAKGKYWADLSRQRGSYLSAVKEIRRRTPSRIKAYVEDALQPLIDTRRILPTTKSDGTPIDLCTVSRDTFNVSRINVQVNYQLPGGLRVTVRPAIGF